MDAKITKTRLSRMLSYDWLKIIGLSAVIIFVWNLIFTMTATRIVPSQEFVVMNYTSNNALTTTFNNSFSNAFKNDVFSYEVIEIGINDLRTAGSSANTVLEARLTTDEGDAIFVAGVGDPDTARVDEETEEYIYITDENGNQTLDCAYTYIDTFVASWYRYIEVLEMQESSPQFKTGYFESMETYLNSLYNGDYVNGELDTEKVESEFRARAKGDKRYKTKSEKRKGVENEILRVEQSRDALVEFNGYLEKGYIELTDVVLEDENGEMRNLGTYAINLCPDERMTDLKKIVNYEKEWIDAEGVTHSETTAEDMHILFFDLGGIDSCFRYEALNYVNYLVRSCCSELQPTENK